MSYTKTYRIHFKETIKISIPVIIGQLSTVLMGVTDSMMVGNVSSKHLSAAALANGVYFIISVIAIGIVMPIATLTAEADGANKREESSIYLRQGVWVGFLASFICGLITFLGADIFFYIDQPIEDARLAAPFMRILSISTIPMVIFLAYKNFCDGLSLTKIGMIMTFLGLLLNVFLNWVLVFGNLGFPKWELNGSGLATLLSRTISLIIIMLYVHKSILFRNILSYAPTWKPNFKVIKKIIYLGLPMGLQWFFEVAGFAGSIIILGWINDASTARSAHQIALNISSVTFMLVTGIASGSSIRVGNAFGMQNKLEMKRAGITGLVIGLCIMTLASLCILLLRFKMPHWYGVEDNPSVAPLASALLIYAAAFQLFDGIQAVSSANLRGVQDVKIPTIITFVAYWLISLPIGYYLTIHTRLGVFGIWWGYIASLSFASIALSWRFWNRVANRA